MLNNRLDKYMLTTEKLNDIKAHKISFKTNDQQLRAVNKITHNYFIPDHTDKLFWCFYIIHFGFDTYEMVGNTFFTVEKKFKIDTIELIRKNKSILKSLKLKKCDVEDQLANCKIIDVTGFMALCAYYNINFMLIKNKTYFEYNCDEDAPIYIIHNINKKFSYQIDNSSKILNDYRDKYYRLENIQKPIKSIGTYKVSELIDIAERLDIDTSNYKNKIELYNLIVIKID